MSDISREETSEECADLDDGDDLLGDPDEYDVCPRCHDDGRDPYNDYLLPCPECNDA